MTLYLKLNLFILLYDIYVKNCKFNLYQLYFNYLTLKLKCIKNLKLLALKLEVLGVFGEIKNLFTGSVSGLEIKVFFWHRIRNFIKN